MIFALFQESIRRAPAARRLIIAAGDRDGFRCRHRHARRDARHRGQDQYRTAFRGANIAVTRKGRSRDGGRRAPSPAGRGWKRGGLHPPNRKYPTSKKSSGVLNITGFSPALAAQDGALPGGRRSGSPRPYPTPDGGTQINRSQRCQSGMAYRARPLAGRARRGEAVAGFTVARRHMDGRWAARSRCSAHHFGSRNSFDRRRSGRSRLPSPSRVSRN